MKIIKKLFGGINLTWTKLIVFAVIMGIYTALVCIIPQLVDTSFHTIAVTFEVWIAIGIFIIMNSKSNLDAALKCFVFFLISQPLVYIIQVPFYVDGWGIFRYYRYWFIWTILCFPMGFIGYYIKKDKWWGYLILFPMIALTAVMYNEYLPLFLFSAPYYILICIFCIVAMLIYPIALFSGRKVRIVGTVISAIIVIAVTAMNLMKPPVYSTDFLCTVKGNLLTEKYQVSLADASYGDVYLYRIDPDSAEDCIVHADFKKKGVTELIVKTPAGEVVKYELDVKWKTFEYKEIDASVEK